MMDKRENNGEVKTMEKQKTMEEKENNGGEEGRRDPS